MGFYRLGQTKDRVSVAEAENELEEVTGISLKLDGTYLTYADMVEVLERLHLNEYIPYEKKMVRKKKSTKRRVGIRSMIKF